MREFMRNNFSAFVIAFALVIFSGAFGTAWAADENGITLIQPTGGTVSYEIKSGFDFASNSFQSFVYLSNTPNEGWRLVKYIVTDGSGNEITISNSTDLATGEIDYYFIKQNATVTAVFEEAAHSITVNNPTGGTVTASVTKASEGDKVDLSYTINDGYLFRCFIVRKTSDNSEVEVKNGSNIAGQYAWYFNMPNEAVTVTAEISASHAITVQNPENGGIDVHATLSSAATGDSIEVIIGASTGYAVKGYAVTKTGDSSVSVSTAFKQGGIGTDKVIFSFTMPDYPVTVSAQTEAMTYTITWNATDCTVNGPSQGHAGDTITFTVTPSEGYSVRTITVNGETTYGIVRKSISGGVYTYEMTLGTGDAFLNNGYTVNVVCDNEGEPGFPITKQFNMGGASITNSAGEEITHAEGGEQVTIKLLQSDGVDYTASCYFYPTGTDPLTPEGIKYANQLTGDNTFIMPFRDMTVLTQGTAKTFNLTVASGIEHGTVTADSAIPAYNFTVVLTIAPDTGYELTKLIVDGADVASQVSDNKYVFRMPAHDVSVSEAVFSAIEYSITYGGIDGATFTAVNPAKYTVETATFTLNNPTRAGYNFAGWTGTEISGTSTNVTIPQASTGNRSYVATWKSLAPFGWTESYNADGSEARPYKISGFEGWNLLVDELNGGESYSGKNFSLEGNLEVTTMLGTNGTGFAGTFEGNGNTLTFDYDGADDYCAPFTYVNGGTIKNLTVEGTIKTSGQHVGGIVGHSSGETTIEACNFVGKLLTTNVGVTIGGGFVAENNGTLTISNSLYAPATLEMDETEPSAEGSATFVRNTDSHTSEIMNSYYTRKLGTEQGKQGYTVTAETGITVALAEGSTNGLSFDGTIYAGSNETVSLTISGGNTKEGYTFKSYKASAGTLTETGWKYSLTMPGENVVISAEFAQLYSVEISGSIENGTVTANFTQAVEGETITLTVIPNTGYSVVSVKYNDTVINPEDDVYSFAMPALNVTVTAEFSKVDYAVNFGGGITNGSITANVSQANYGDTITLTVKTGYSVANVKVNGDSVAVTDNGNGTYSFTMPAGAVEITADVTEIEYIITYDLDGGTATGNPTKYTVETSTFTLTNPTKNGSTFAGWTGTGLASAMMSVTIEKGSTGARTYTATWTGGGSDPDPDVPTFNEKHSIILEGEIGLKFYVYLPEIDGVDYTGSYMEFDISGDKSNALKYYNAGNSRSIDGRTHYFFTCYVSSVQMADKITAVFHYGDGLTVSQESSVKEYLDNIIEGSFTNEAKDLMCAIQDYGHFAQQMLSQANNWTIGEDFAEMPASVNYANDSYDDSEIAEARDGVKDYAIVRDTGDSGIEKVEYSLLFDSKTTINVYLTVKSTYNGTVSAPFNGTEAMKLSDGRYLVQIRNIPAHELATMHEINVTAGSSFTIKVAALSYVDTMINKTDATVGGVELQKLKNAVASFYFYYAKAIAYQDSLNQ